MPNKITWSAIALTNLFIGWVVYIFSFYPFDMQAKGYWLMFFMAIGGGYSAYRLLKVGNRAFKMQLVFCLGELLMALLLWGGKLYKYGSSENGGLTYLLKTEAELISYFIDRGEIIRGLQLVVWDVLPFWLVFWAAIYASASRRNDKEPISNQ